MTEANDYTTPPPPPSGTPSAEERQWAMFAHLSALLGGLLTGAVGGWGSFIGPLIIWLVKKDSMPFVNDQAKEALNFQITVTIIYVAGSILTVIAIGPLISFAAAIVSIIFSIMGFLKAKDGIAYRYPFALRLIK